MMKSAHPDVSLWSYERPSRGYFGYHLRTKSADTRARLHQKLSALKPSEPILLRFGAKLSDVINAGWPRTEYGYLMLVRGDTPVETSELSIAIPDESWPIFMALLDRIEVNEEDSVNVVTPSAHVPLWVWWDAQ